MAAAWPMNVLMVTGIFPPDIGGPATYVPVMGSELVKRGHKVTVVTLSDTLDHNDLSYPFRLKRIRRGFFKVWRFLLTVAAIMREGRQAQLLYVNGLYLEAVIANYFLRRPMVQKIVGDWAWERATNRRWIDDNFEEFQKRRYGFKVELLKALRTFSVHRADSLITPSEYLARAVTKWGVSESKISIIYNAVDISSAASISVPLTTQFKIVTVGRLVPWKQIDHLIEALAEIKDAGLIIVGDGPERNRLEQLARDRHLADRVYFVGKRSKEETLALMAGCDLFVLNSTYEGFPHVIVEAMAVSLPVVATAVGGTPELICDGENGVLVPPAANGLLSSTIASLISSLAHRQRLIKGAKQTVKQFQQSVMLEETEAVLRNCAFQGER
jgi:glycosyltransferase involved in cell wall biosynthesis